MNSLPINRDFMRKYINTKRTDGDDRRSVLREPRTWSSTHRMNSCQKLGRKNRFTQVVIGTRLQATNLMLYIFLVSQHYQQRVMALAHFLPHGESLHIPQGCVQND